MQLRTGRASVKQAAGSDCGLAGTQQCVQWCLHFGTRFIARQEGRTYDGVDARLLDMLHRLLVPELLQVVLQFQDPSAVGIVQPEVVAQHLLHHPSEFRAPRADCSWREGRAPPAIPC